MCNKDKRAIGEISGE